MRNCRGRVIAGSWVRPALKREPSRADALANIHETGCDGRAFLGVHRPITAGTSNDRKFAQVAYHRWAAPGCSRDPPQQTRSRSLRLNAMRREFLI
jgi:hypothetical protein